MVMIKMPNIKTIMAMATVLSTTTSTVVEGFQLKNQEGASKKQVVEGNVIQVADEVLRSELSTTFSNVGKEFQDLGGSLGSDGGYISSSSSSVVGVPSDSTVRFDTTTSKGGIRFGRATSGRSRPYFTRELNQFPENNVCTTSWAGRRGPSGDYLVDGRTIPAFLVCDGWLWDSTGSMSRDSQTCIGMWIHGMWNPWINVEYSFGAFYPAGDYTTELVGSESRNYRWNKYMNNHAQAGVSLSQLICSAECCKIQGGDGDYDGIGSYAVKYGLNNNGEDRFRNAWGNRGDGTPRTPLCDWKMCGGCPECATRCAPGDPPPCPQN